MWWRIGRKHRPWLDTARCRDWQIEGKAKLLIGKHLFAGGVMPHAANDREIWRW